MKIVTYVCLVVFAVAGCTEQRSPQQGDAPVLKPTKSAPQNVLPTPADAASTFRLGDHMYELGMVICFGTSPITVTASDPQKRSDHPVVSIRIYDDSVKYGQSFDTVSALFFHDDYEEHWKLEVGEIKKVGNTVVASGTLNGNLLLPKPDGTRRSVPMESASVKTFQAKLEC